jgi:hypothetical protein
MVCSKPILATSSVPSGTHYSWCRQSLDLRCSHTSCGSRFSGPPQFLVILLPGDNSAISLEGYSIYWLTRSVLLQKEELLETRKALEESAAAQVKHALSAEESIRVAAFTALLNSAVTEVQSLRELSSSLIAQSSSHHSGSARLPTGKWAGQTEVIAYLDELGTQTLGQKTRAAY